MTRRGLALAAAAGAAITALPRLSLGQTAAPTVRTTHGPIIGGRDGDVSVFKGVRYGADTAQRRFQPPAPPSPWTDPVETLAYGASAPQGRPDVPASEDCLFLNVWTPGLDGEKRPVMVYIHGGAYSNGSGSDPLYDGTRLARRQDVVVVTLNHRLNVFGYAFLARLAPGFGSSGNAGQLDLILALQWVRDNIAAFGGDPGRVMVFGQSGGGAKIATLMATPAAAGLFHTAATMSGQQVTASGPINATRRTQAWLAAMDLPVERIGELATMPWEKLLEGTSARDPILTGSGLYMGPVMDDVVLHRHPFYPDAAPQSASMPMIIGNTHDETLAFLGNDPANANLTWHTLVGRLTPEQLRIDIQPETVIAWYRQSHPELSPDQVLIAATTAGRSWRGAVIEAEVRAATAAAGAGRGAWVYQLDFKASLSNGRKGAYHTADIPLVFDNVAAPGSGAPSSGVAAAEAQGAADLMSGAFASLARTGDPNHASLPDWTRYDLTRRQTMVFDTTARMADDPRGDERAFFSRVPYIQPGT
ncbi:carboxylesterase/lipase family protein [Brevundimonas sp.]|uniref:carboxylesterase/lipase family protein n=1 Tax=Brevundimonas sp. TaxID=1871086 RepID=UPI003458DB2F